MPNSVGTKVVVDDGGGSPILAIEYLFGRLTGEDLPDLVIGLPDFRAAVFGGVDFFLRLIEKGNPNVVHPVTEELPFKTETERLGNNTTKMEVSIGNLSAEYVFDPSTGDITVKRSALDIDYGGYICWSGARREFVRHVSESYGVSSEGGSVDFTEDMLRP